MQRATRGELYNATRCAMLGRDVWSARSSAFEPVLTANASRGVDIGPADLLAEFECASSRWC